MTEEKLCSKCGRNPAEELHPCPYQQEIYGEEEELCDCCCECQGDCNESI